MIDASILSLVTIHSYCISPFLSFLPPTFLWQVFGAQALHCCHGAVNQNKNGTRVLLLRKLDWIPCLYYTAKKNYAILQFNSEALFTRTSHSHTIFWKVNLLSGISKYGLSHDFTSTFYLKNIISEAYFSKLACTFADFFIKFYLLGKKPTTVPWQNELPSGVNKVFNIHTMLKSVSTISSLYVLTWQIISSWSYLTPSSCFVNVLVFPPRPVFFLQLDLFINS